MSSPISPICEKNNKCLFVLAMERIAQISICYHHISSLSQEKGVIAWRKAKPKKGAYHMSYGF